MIGQDFNDAALCDLSAPALTDHAFEFALKDGEAFDPGIDVQQMRTRNPVGLLARSVWIVAQRKQGPDGVERKAELATMPDESQAIGMRVAVNALIPSRAGWQW
jgi:hypothetical protein